MPIFKTSTARILAQNEKRKSFSKTASKILQESTSFDYYKGYDVFLSHSYSDAEVILGIKAMIESLGYSVYVDWVSDQSLSRDNVNRNTAKVLRYRMNKSRSLFYVTTKNSTNSKWMPWETGYFDGRKGKVAIFPLNESSQEEYNFIGIEYLELYPYITVGSDGNMYLVDENKNWTNYDTWLKE